jgi:LysM repeat protein
MKHYQEHDLIPNYPELDQQLTETIMVYDHTSFYEIAQVTELPLDLIETLNPAYLQGFIPARQKGYYLTLPKRFLGAFQDYLDKKRPDFEARMRVQSTPVYVSKPNTADNLLYQQSTYTVLSGETLDAIANRLGCAVHQLKAWNNLQSDELELGQQLVIFKPKKIKRFDLLGHVPLLMPISSPDFPDQITSQNKVNYPIHQIKRQLIESDGYLCYRLDKRESPFDISLKLSFISYSVLSRLNMLKDNEPLPIGTLLRVKKL